MGRNAFMLLESENLKDKVNNTTIKVRCGNFEVNHV